MKLTPAFFFSFFVLMVVWTSGALLFTKLFGIGAVPAVWTFGAMCGCVFASLALLLRFGPQ